MSDADELLGARMPTRRAPLRRAFALALPFLLAVTTTAAPARAQDDPRKLQAEPAFQEGVSLHAQKREAEALEKFKKAYAIYPSPNTLVNVAREEQLVGRRLEALRHYREALKAPLLHPQLAANAKQWLAQLEPAFGRIEVKGPAGLTFEADGASYTLPLAGPLDVEPGAKSFAGTVGDTRYEGAATAVAGTVVSIELTPTSPPAGRVAAPSSPEVSTAPPALPARSFWTTRHVAGAGLGALAVVSAGVGIGFLVARAGHVSDQEALAADARVCLDPASASCQALHDGHDAAVATKVGAIVSFAAAGALGAGALILLWPRDATSTGVRARVVPTGRGLSMVGTF